MSPLNMRTSNWFRVHISKTGVNGLRINKMIRRRKIVEACFVAVPRLVLSNGSRKLPSAVLSRLAK